MKLVMYQFGERDYRLGAMKDEDLIIDLNYAYETHLTRKGEPRAKELAQALVPPNSVEFLHGGDRSWEAAQIALDAVSNFGLADLSSSKKRFIFQRSEVKLGAPVQNPLRIICLAHNYHDFIRETGQPIPPEPRIFAKYRNALCGPDDPIIYPKMTQCLGYEAELAFIVGKKGRNVLIEKAYNYVAGYMIFNDVSASDLTALDKQVVRGKTFDNFAPCGPYLVTKDEIDNPSNLNVKLWVNDRLLQNSNTRELIYDVPTLVSFLSRIFTLEPGDIIATGTPGGLAKDRKPPAYMQIGDICTIEISGLGRLSNKIVAEEDISF
ncbi:MAG: hypothetical protein PWP65_2122 [Clostridia bacterium]|nr:hypothetical protein [Clostridia bacterium]